MIITLNVIPASKTVAHLDLDPSQFTRIRLGIEDGLLGSLFEEPTGKDISYEQNNDEYENGNDNKVKRNFIVVV